MKVITTSAPPLQSSRSRFSFSTCVDHNSMPASSAAFAFVSFFFVKLSFPVFVIPVPVHQQQRPTNENGIQRAEVIPLQPEHCPCVDGKQHPPPRRMFFHKFSMPANDEWDRAYQQNPRNNGAHQSSTDGKVLRHRASSRNNAMSENLLLSISTRTPESCVPLRLCADWLTSLSFIGYLSSCE